VLSLDVWRAIERTGALDSWLNDVRRRIDLVKADAPRSAASRARESADRIERYVTDARGSDREAGARQLAFAIARVTAAVGLIEHAAWAQSQNDPDARDPIRFADRWARHDLASGLG
jgi:hypothetical protein